LGQENKILKKTYLEIHAGMLVTIPAFGIYVVSDEPMRKKLIVLSQDAKTHMRETVVCLPIHFLFHGLSDSFRPRPVFQSHVCCPSHTCSVHGKKLKTDVYQIFTPQTA
jgi:hypothetical protein